MKKTILAFLAIGTVQGIVNRSVEKAAPREVKSYPTKVRLGLILVAAASLAYAQPFLENKILGKDKPAKLFGMDILS